MKVLEVGNHVSRDGKHDFKMPQNKRKKHRSKYDRSIEEIVKSLNVTKGVRHIVARAILQKKRKPISCDIVTADELHAREDAKDMIVIHAKLPPIC